MKFILLAGRLVNLDQVMGFSKTEGDSVWFIKVEMVRGGFEMQYGEEFKRDEDFVALQKMTEALVGK